MNKIIYTKEEFPLVMSLVENSISATKESIVNLKKDLNKAEKVIGHNVQNLYDNKIKCKFINDQTQKNKKKAEPKDMLIRNFVSLIKRKLADEKLKLLQLQKIYNVSSAVYDNYDIIQQGDNS